jgi:phosphatidylglycerol---prolipoprotein diacylglyceryl transferase
MPWSAIPYPKIDPVALHIGPFALHWYALAYSGGMVCMWIFAHGLIRRDALWNGTPRPTPAAVDYLIFYMFFGTMIGGRLGEVLLNPSVYLPHPTEIFAVWHGGGSFHGAVTGACFAIMIFARRNHYSFWTALDVCAPGGAIGVFFGHIANFINAELWGTRTDVPWAMVFPGAAGSFPRHPTQIYEALLEGVLVLVLVIYAIRAGGLKRPGLVAGLFGTAYGAARGFCEFFREPDPNTLHLVPGMTTGLFLSLLMIPVCGAVMALAGRRQPGSTQPDAR